jgi:hypothetical protein
MSSMTSRDLDNNNILLHLQSSRVSYTESKRKIKQTMGKIYSELFQKWREAHIDGNTVVTIEGVTGRETFGVGARELANGNATSA